MISFVLGWWAGGGSSHMLARLLGLQLEPKVVLMLPMDLGYIWQRNSSSRQRKEEK
jgi:hypothetical protein